MVLALDRLGRAEVYCVMDVRGSRDLADMGVDTAGVPLGPVDPPPDVAEMAELATGGVSDTRRGMLVVMGKGMPSRLRGR